MKNKTKRKYTKRNLSYWCKKQKGDKGLPKHARVACDLEINDMLSNRKLSPVRKVIKRAMRKRVLVDSITGKPVAMLKNNAIVMNYVKKPYTKSAKWYKAHDKRTIQLEFLQWLMHHEAMHAMVELKANGYEPKPGRPSKRDLIARYLLGNLGGVSTLQRRGRPWTAQGLLRALKK